MTKPTVLVLGGRSDIGLAVARRFAAAGHPIQLAARNAAGLEADRADIALRHQVPVSLHEYDVLASAPDAWIDALPALPGIVVCVVGLLGDQTESARDADRAAEVMRTNYEGPALILGAFANRFEAQGSGAIVGVSSVAGDRGRGSNYVYGSAKAGFTAFLSGLRNRLAVKGVKVVTVKPGFVATRMTEGMQLPPKLTAKPEDVAAVIETAVGRGRDVVYVKPVWALIMLIIRHLPEAVFKRARL
ncbi:MAG: SDR family oxidoreductase [Pseudomonadota bacterium]